MTTPTVIFITHVIPYPPAAGNEIRILKVIRWLRGRGYRVVLLLKVHSMDSKARATLEKVVDAVHCLNDDIGEVSLPASKDRDSIISGVLSRVGGIITRNSFFNRRPTGSADENEYQKKSAELKKSLCPDKLIRMSYHFSQKYNPHAVIAEYIFTAPCLDVVPSGALKLIDTHDMFSRKKNQVLSFGIEDLLHCTPEEERKYLLRSDVVVAIQKKEAEMFQTLVPEREVVTVGIDYDIVERVDNSEVIPGTVLVVGSDNPLNVHGLQTFYKEAWPAIRSRSGNATLRVIGKLGTKFQCDDPRVSIAGWVENLDAEYRRAAVVINPTVAGTGLKIKSVEALCRAKPLVGTPNSVEGILFEGEPPFVVGHNWTEFSDALCSLLDGEDRRLDLQRRALDYAREHFSAERVYAPLSRFFPACGRVTSNLSLLQRNV